MKTDLVITFGGSIRKRAKAIWSLSGTVLALVFYRHATITFEDVDLSNAVKKV